MQTKYLGIASDIRQRIERGELRPGDRVPTTKEISERYGVAEGTAQQVLRMLDRWGVILRRSRRGSWVRGQPPYRLLVSGRYDRGIRNAGPSSFEREVAESGYLGEVEYLFTGWTDATPADACMLGVQAGDRIVERSRRQWATPLIDGRPVAAAREVVQLMRSVFPGWVGEQCPAVLGPCGPGGSYSRIDDTIGVIDTAVESVVFSRPATETEAELFEFERVTQVAQLTRRGYIGGRDGELVEVGTLVMLPGMTGLEYEVAIRD